MVLWMPEIGGLDLETLLRAAARPGDRHAQYAFDLLKDPSAGRNAVETIGVPQSTHFVTSRLHTGVRSEATRPLSTIYSRLAAPRLMLLNGSHKGRAWSP